MDEQQQRNKKRTKAGVLVSEITYADLESAFHLPTERACVKLGVGLTILKRLCRKHGIPRWPYRSLLKAGKAQRVPNSPSSSSPLPSPRVLAGPASCLTPTAAAVQACRPSASSDSQASQPASCSEASNRPASCTAAAAPPATAPAPTPAKAPAAAPVEQQPQPQPQMPGSQLGVLLSAIDACEEEEVEEQALQLCSSAPAAPLDSARAWAPFTPPAGSSSGGVPQPAPAARQQQQRRAFTHSSRSAFQPVRPVALRPMAPAAEDAQHSELAQRLALLQEVQAQVMALAPPAPMPDAAASLLRALGAEGMDEQRRLQMAEKLLLVRAALQARIARKRAAMAAAAGGRYNPYPLQLLPALRPDASGPVSIASLPAGNSDIMNSLSSTDFRALSNARSLLSQYRL